MKILKSAVLVWLVALIVPALTALGENTELKSIRPVYPTLAESADYWRHARIIIDTSVGTRLYLVFGHTTLYGGPGIFCIRVSRGQMIIQELFYEAGESGTPLLEARKGSTVLRMPSGFVLAEIEKEPTQSGSRE